MSVRPRACGTDKRVLCAKHLRGDERIQRLMQTVGALLLYGSVLWAVTAGLGRRQNLQHSAQEVYMNASCAKFCKFPEGAPKGGWRFTAAGERPRSGCARIVRGRLSLTGAGGRRRPGIDTLPGVRRCIALGWRGVLWWRSMQALSETAAGGAGRRHPAQNWRRTPDTQLATCCGLDWAPLAQENEIRRSRSAGWLANLDRGRGKRSRSNRPRHSTPPAQMTGCASRGGDARAMVSKHRRPPRSFVS